MKSERPTYVKPTVKMISLKVNERIASVCEIEGSIPGNACLDVAPTGDAEPMS